jgi:hypothetical protein
MPIRNLAILLNLLIKISIKARAMNYRPLLSFRSQFFHSLLHLSSHAKQHHITHPLRHYGKFIK